MLAELQRNAAPRSVSQIEMLNCAGGDFLGRFAVEELLLCGLCFWIA